MTARLDLPRTREAILADYYEIRGFGDTHDGAARRLGLTPRQMSKRLESEKTMARRGRSG